MNEDNFQTQTIVLNAEELDKILSKYFKTQEDLSKEYESDDYVSPSEELDNILSKYFSTKEEQQSYNESTILSDVEFQKELLLKIDSLRTNTQYANNQSYVAIFIALLLFFSVLFYKFLKIFI